MKECGIIIKLINKATTNIKIGSMERWLSWSKAHDWKSCNG